MMKSEPEANHKEAIKNLTGGSVDSTCQREY